MGNWYANIALKGPSQTDVLGALREWNRTALVSAPTRGFVVVYDRACRAMDGDDSERLAARLTSRFGCVAVIALNADDDVLWLCAYDRGKRAAEYDSSTPSRSGAAALCRALGWPLVTPVLWVVLQGPMIFEVLRHRAVCRLLGMPGYLCTCGYPEDDDGTLIDSDLFRSTYDDPDAGP